MAFLGVEFVSQSSTYMQRASLTEERLTLSDDAVDAVKGKAGSGEHVSGCVEVGGVGCGCG